MRRRLLAIFATFFVATFATTTGIVLDFEVGSQSRQIKQLQIRVTRLERAAQPRIRLTAAVQACPPGAACLPVLLVTDGAKGMGAPFLIEDNQGRPPGQNAPMFWVDGFQAGSVNPVCAAAVSPFLAREACLGGPPFDATGGHAVLALWDGTRWQVLTARDIAWLHRAEQLRPGW